MRPETRRSLPALLLILLLAGLVFLPALSGVFIWDDRDLITHNAFLQSPGFPLRCWFTPYNGPLGEEARLVQWTRAPLFYRPLTLFSFWLDWKIWGMNPAAFHLTSLALHLLATALAAALILAAGGDAWLACMGALLFSLFPLHGESVAWISGRTDLLAFVLLAASGLLFMRWRSGRGGPLLPGLLFFLSLLAKESGLLLALLPAGAALLNREKAASALRASLPFVAGAASWAALRLMAIGLPAGEWSAYPWFAPFAALGFYVRSLLLPWRLTLTIDPLPVLASAGLALAGGGLLLGALALAWRRKEGWRPLLVLLAGLLLSLLPFLIIPFSASVVSPMAWRFLYLPSFFLLAALVLALQRLVRLPPTVKLALVALLSFSYLIELLPQAKLFGRDEAGFWLGIERLEEQSPLAQINVAAVLLERNDRRGLAICQRLLDRRNDPQQRQWDMTIYENLASFHAGRNENDKAALYFEKLQAYAPALPLGAQLKIAFFMVLRGKKERGAARFESLLAAYPRNHDVLRYAAEAMIVLGRRGRARELLQRDYALHHLPETLHRLRRLPSGAP